MDQLVPDSPFAFTGPNRRQRRADAARERGSRSVIKAKEVTVYSPVEDIDWLPGVHFAVIRGRVLIIDHPEGVETMIDVRTGKVGSVHAVQVKYGAGAIEEQKARAQRRLEAKIESVRAIVAEGEA